MAIERWEVDAAHSGVSFSVRHMVISKVRGKFGRFTASLEVDPADTATLVATARINAASIDTGVSDRDVHLRSADFFDAERFPELVFQSTGVERTGPEKLKVTGDLTIRGVTQPVTLEVEEGGRVKDPYGGERIGLIARTSLDRKAYGLGWNQVLEAGGVLVGERVDIDIEIQAVKQQAERLSA